MTTSTHYNFEGSHALVTGGASGIGRAIGLALASAGCRVTCTGVTEAEVAALGDGLPAELKPRVDAVALDVTSDVSIARAVSRHRRLDILINAAGTILRGGAEFDPVKFQRVLDVNLTGVMRMCTTCRPLLAQQGGSIVNVASMLSYFGSGSVPGYSASKGGVAQLTKSLAIAWAADKIRVNAIAPGWIVTPLTQPLVDSEKWRQAIIDRTPLGRWGEPAEVAGPALFLCSPAAAFVTGAILPVDGGYSIF